MLYVCVRVCERVVCVCDNVVSERVDREGADGTGRSRRSADGSAEHRMWGKTMKNCLLDLPDQNRSKLPL